MTKQLNLAKGEIENERYRRCQRFECGYYQTGECRLCEECKSLPLILDKGCLRCDHCENIPGKLRFTDLKAKQTKQVERPITDEQQFVREELMPMIEERLEEERSIREEGCHA